MALIPGGVRRGSVTRSDLSYARYSRATWEWWCREHGADFVVIDTAPSDGVFAQMPPTLQRWVMLDRVLAERGPDAQVIAVDADTMIRWDTPDIFERARGLSAVADPTPPEWIVQSISLFRHLFPETSVPWWEYFNAGLVVFGAAQRRVLHAFADFAGTHWTELQAAIKQGGLGTDQTALNFIARRENEPVFLLPRPYNLLHCFPMDRELFELEGSPTPDRELFAKKAFSRGWAFNFVDYGYVWHFANIVALRSLVMGETWRRIRLHYPGAVCDGDH
jgi:hypothetical protein